MTRREQIITELLERHTELSDPMQSRDKNGDGEPIPLNANTYTPSVKELERLMTLMRTQRKSQWWHVTQRYIACVHATKDVRAKRRGKNGKTAIVIERRLIATYHNGVRLEKVRRGVTWLADNWGKHDNIDTPSPVVFTDHNGKRWLSEPELPKELRIAA